MEEVERLRAENDELRRQLAIRDKTIEVQALQIKARDGRLERCEARGRVMHAYLAWERDLFANPDLSASEKLTLVSARGEYERQTEKNGPADPEPTDAPADPDAEPALIPVYVDDIAKRCGVSRSTAGDNIKKLEKSGALSVKRKHAVSDFSGQPILRVSLAPTLAALAEPAHLAPPEPRNHGGKRRACPHCGGERLERRIICMDCGSILDSHPVNPITEPEPGPEPLTLESLTVDAPPAQETSPLSQDDSEAEQLPPDVTRMADYCQPSPTRHHEYAQLRDVDRNRLCLHCGKHERVRRPLRVEMPEYAV